MKIDATYEIEAAKTALALGHAVDVGALLAAIEAADAARLAAERQHAEAEAQCIDAETRVGHLEAMIFKIDREAIDLDDVAHNRLAAAIVAATMAAQEETPPAAKIASNVCTPVVATPRKPAPADDAASRLIEIDGTTRTLIAWCVIRGVNLSTARARLRRGMSPVEALSPVTSARKRGQK